MTTQNFIKYLFRALILSLMLSAGLSHARAERAPSLSVAQIDQFLNAADILQNKDLDGAKSAFRELADQGYVFAHEMIDLIEWIESRGTDKETKQPLDLLQRMQDPWKAARYVPPSSAGNNLVFKALQSIPREYDETVVDWISTRYQDYPPPFPLEAARRLFESDRESAVYWLSLSVVRLRFEVERCGDSTLRDLPQLWNGYIAGAIAKMEEENPGEIKRLYAGAIKRILSNWDAIVPYDMKVWQSCQGNNPITGTGALPVDAWREASDRLRQKYSDSLKKHSN